jgi:transcriptional regulator with XRE-family HTH domain
MKADTQRRKTTGRKPATPYEQPTDEKRMYGGRLRAARELAGLTLTDAATRLGYSQPVQLSLMENGIRMPHLPLIRRASDLYGVTADFLVGAVDDADIDPVNALQRHIELRITAELRRLIGNLADLNGRVVRDLMPESAEGQRLAGLVLELSAAITDMRARNKRFDDMPGSARVLARIELASAAAQAYAQHAERTRRILRRRLLTGTEEISGQGDAQLSLLPALEPEGA